MTNQENNFEQIDVSQRMNSELGKQPPVSEPKLGSQDTSSVSSPPIIEDKNDFRNVAMQILTNKCEWVRITNEKGPKSGSVVYELFINKKTIRITERDVSGKHVFLFDLRENKLFLDQELQSEEMWDGFVKKLNKIGKDLSENKAKMTEKQIPISQR